MGNYNSKTSVFRHKWGRYSKTEKIFIIYAIILGACLLFMPIITISPISNEPAKVFGLINTYFIKSNIIIFLSFIILVGWSISYRFKAFLNQVIGFKENDMLFSLALLMMMTTSFVSIGDVTFLIKNNFTYTISLTNRYYFISLLLLLGIIYTLWQVLSQARHISRANMVNIHDDDGAHHSHYDEENPEDAKENFADHLKQGLFDK